ncbi:MAG: hypothetical protein SCK57_13385 [Bacillota bacterium]|nr:hypothetical protein [Bacillota bacterium]
MSEYACLYYTMNQAIAGERVAKVRQIRHEEKKNKMNRLFDEKYSLVV